MLTAVVGVNWGDEGKGRMVDLLSGGYDIICRYQGGNNAGHTVVNDRGKFVLNLLPSGVFREGTINVMGLGMVIDLEHLWGEMGDLAQKGVKIEPGNLKISDRSFICLPYHKMQDILEEERLGDKKYGSTRRGIAPVYGDKYMKKGLRMGDLLDPASLEEKVGDLLSWKNLTLQSYDSYKEEKDLEAQKEEILSWLGQYGEPLLPYICDTRAYLARAQEKKMNILFEAQLGSLRDIDYGIYPYTSSSQTLASFAPIGAGIPGARVDHVIGVMKAYSSCVGEGPFVVEMEGPEAELLREQGAEYGAATGRPRRVGAFDVPASSYGIQVQGAHEIALTKLDVLSYMDSIPVCVAYEVQGRECRDFPTGEKLAKARPVYEYLDGFKKDISQCRYQSELPKEALQYIRYLEKAVSTKIKYVSVGAGRDSYIIME
ncbi:MAG: adenylosuccinate synthase [Treponema sp.]|nr:adenylosuccinate synthase [Treponema sp.]